MPNDLSITATILKLAERQEGVSSREAAAAVGVEHTRSVQRLLSGLTRANRLHKVGPHMHSRWFANEQHANAHARTTGSWYAPVQVRGKPNERMRRLHQAALGEHNKEKAQRINGDQIITERTRVIVAPPPRSRYQVDEAPRVVDAQQCRPWAREVL